MYGSDIYQLRVRLMERGVASAPIVWQKQGNKGDEWLLGTVFVGDGGLREAGRFVLEGVVGEGWEGDIALDDVAFNEGPCPVSNVCDFEQVDLCGYADEEGGDFGWERVQGGSVNEADHSYGTNAGHFMLAKAIVMAREASGERFSFKSYL